MCYANNEKQEITHDGRNRATKPIKNQNAQSKRNLQVLGNIRSGHNKKCGDERKNLKEYLRKTRKLLETKLLCRNLIKGINARSFVRYSELFLKWARDELKQVDQRTRKLMTMHKALHTRDDVDRIYVSRKGRWKGPTSIEDSVDALIQKPEENIKKSNGWLITASINNADNTSINRTK